jgi:MerR family transcriptional regulator/heat shock protein HspR
MAAIREGKGARGGQRMRDAVRTRPVYVISIAAEITGLHPRTLRIYEERGLLAPVRRNRIRLYSDEDIERVRIIRQLIEAHRLNLAGVRLILDVYERLADDRPDGHEEGDVVQWLVERIIERRGGGRLR